jgi:hypothetical protein
MQHYLLRLGDGRQLPRRRLTTEAQLQIVVNAQIGSMRYGEQRDAQVLACFVDGVLDLVTDGAGALVEDGVGR